MEIGANDYISKPFDIQIVKARIENIIKNVKRVSEISKIKVNLVPDDTSVDSIDSLFIKKAHSILDENFDNPDFTAEMFKKKMGMSHSALYRKLKQLTGQSSNEFIRSYRLKRAAQIIRQDSGLLIAEICIKTGFNDPKYFSKCFKQEHMLTPSEYAKRYVSESKSNPSSGLP
ncbi:helix-turn-helix domain-containing protein [Zobellia nedashkovskayae]